ncbi:hypothetical protein CO611_10280 [Lysobacteraceae bacterium NML03-0222]|nr:hypothetical protein CO611_10280 [Xanthomonadaceae bacterium NML03-0222]PJK06818.1 hypothetical protein CO612_01575 [Xanthomonadaceae bacterium NML71-0210]PJK15100.1 hypothetical protein CO613_02565 [Xanthomonadaceae bacterium NML07-0707]
MSKKILFALAFCVALTACNKQEEAPAEAVAPAVEASEAAPAAEAAGTDVAAAEAAPATDLPQACADYIARAEACFAKAAPDAAAMMKTSFDATVTEWKNAVDKSSLGEACKQMNDMFAQTAAALSCE